MEAAANVQEKLGPAEGSQLSGGDCAQVHAQQPAGTTGPAVAHQVHPASRPPCGRPSLFSPGRLAQLLPVSSRRARWWVGCPVRARTRIKRWPWPVWLSGWGASLCTEGSLPGSIPVKGTCQGCGLHPPCGGCGRQPIKVFLGGDGWGRGVVLPRELGGGVDGCVSLLKAKPTPPSSWQEKLPHGPLHVGEYGPDYPTASIHRPQPQTSRL